MPGRPITIGLLYIGKYRLNVRIQLRRLVTKFFSQVELKIYFRSDEKCHLYFVLKTQYHLFSGQRWFIAVRVLAVMPATLGKPPDISTLAFLSILAYLQ